MRDTIETLGRTPVIKKLGGWQAVKPHLEAIGLTPDEKNVRYNWCERGLPQRAIIKLMGLAAERGIKTRDADFQVPPKPKKADAREAA